MDSETQHRKKGQRPDAGPTDSVDCDLESLVEIGSGATSRPSSRDSLPPKPKFGDSIEAGPWICEIELNALYRYEEGLLNSVADTRLQLEGKQREFCTTCLHQKADHYVCDCPYLKRIPEEVGDCIGPGCDIVCLRCGVRKDEHQGKVGVDWIGRVVYKWCAYCGSSRKHSSKECKNPVELNLMGSKLVEIDPSLYENETRRDDSEDDGEEYID